MRFTFSCYVIRHGDDYMVWDRGYQPRSNPSAPNVSLADQLGKLNIRPEQVKYVGISHFHAGHTGQLGRCRFNCDHVGLQEVPGC